MCIIPLMFLSDVNGDIATFQESESSVINGKVKTLSAETIFVSHAEVTNAFHFVGNTSLVQVGNASASSLGLVQSIDNSSRSLPANGAINGAWGSNGSPHPPTDAPEPSSAAIFLGACAILGMRRRRIHLSR